VWAVVPVLVGLALRVWVMRSPLAPLNSDEALTGLQGYESLEGKLRLIVAGNGYGATTESYVAAAFVWLWHGVTMLRLIPVVFTGLTAWVIARWARPIAGREVAVTIGLVSWIGSGATILLSVRPYMGYSSGVLAMVIALHRSCRSADADEPDWRWSAVAGFAAGFAAWSHPMFGVIAALGLAVPTIRWWREIRRWWLPAGIAALVGVSPWLLFVARHGKPRSAGIPIDLSYRGRVTTFFAQLFPRAFGFRTQAGLWVGPDGLMQVAYVVLLAACLIGPLIIIRRRSWYGWPVLVALWVGLPALAVFPQLAYAADSRYALPFLPLLLIGLSGWAILLPDRVRISPALVLVVPLLWAAAFCLPVLHAQIPWELVDPDRGTEQIVDLLQERGITALRGDYWAMYSTAFLSDDEVLTRPDYEVRLHEDAEEVVRTPSRQVAFAYTPAQVEAGTPQLLLPVDHYDRVPVNGFYLFIPR
jgi:hypothetical protein